MQFGQIEREGLDGELWQRSQLPVHLHSHIQQTNESHLRRRLQDQAFNQDSTHSSSPIHWLTKLLQWNVRR